MLPPPSDQKDSSAGWRVALLANSYLPYLSGVSISLNTLARALRDLGHEIKIFAPAYPPDYPPGSRREQGLEVFRFISLRTPFYPKFRLNYPLTLTAVRELRDFQPEIIHSQTPFLTGLMGQIMARRLKVPSVLTFHTLFTEYLHYLPLLPPKLTRPAASGYLKFFCQRCDAIITPSEPVRKMLQDQGITRPISVIPTGIPAEQFYPFKNRTQLRQRLGVPEEAVLLIYAGRLGREKNLFFLLEAFAEIRRQTDKVCLLLVGSGPLESELKARAGQLGLEKAVLFTGEVPHQDIGSYYQAADIFLTASRTETQGLVLTEAKAAALPVVALDAFGTGEMVRHGSDGYLCTEENFAASVLELIVSQNKREQMAREAFSDAHHRFSAEVMAASVERLYRDLLV